LTGIALMEAIVPFLTGLGLFFCGAHSLSSHLVPLAGRRMRVLLMRVGGRPWLAAAFGSAGGVLMQSTNAVTSVIIALVSGGLIDKRRAILIPTWSHVGTSILVILVAIDLSLAAGYLVALAGLAVYSVSIATITFGTRWESCWAWGCSSWACRC
jgi:phosphate:Na+ symporter